MGDTAGVLYESLLFVHVLVAAMSYKWGAGA
ncbi:hypothetical protein BH23ACT9_BH23ACT9_33350 [soil metagenome]